MSSPATAPQVSASSLSFLSAYASTQRFRVGLPTAATLVAADATGDGEFVYFLRTEDAAHSSQNLYELCVSTGSERLLVAAADLVAVESMSDAERQLRERQRMTSKGLLSVQMRPNHRREMLLPYQAHLYLIQAATGRTTNLTANSRFEAFGPPSYVQFSPDGQKVCFIRSGDIFLLEVPADLDSVDAAAQPRETRLTFTGTTADPHASNGVAEFIAQEEIGRFKGYWWSPDSTSLLYQHTDTRPLEQFGILDLQNPGNDTDRNPYPRPGKQNATVTLGILRVPQQTDSDVADTAASKKRRLADGTAASAQTESAASSPETKWLDWDTTAYPYLCTVAWESSSAPLTLVVQNRLQTETAVLVVPDIASGACRTLLTLRDDRWVSIDHSSPRWLTDGRHFLLSSDQLTEYDTLYLYDASGKRIRPLHDSTTVMYRRLLHVDEARDVCYVLGGPNPTEQHVWRISLGLAAGSTTAGEATSITSSPAIHNAVFSADGATFVHERANLTEGTRFFVRRIASDFGATTDSTADDARAGAVLAQLRIVAAVVPPEHAPRVKLKQIIGDESIALAELAASDALVKADRDTNALTQALEELRRAAAGTETATSTETTQAATTTTSSSSHTYYAAVLRPADYSPSRRYPVICYVYGGPGHRLVTCDRSMWLVAQWMANQGYIVVTSDNRGTPCRGAAWEKAIKGDFQELPLRDQVIVLRTLAASDPSMDLSRGVGIFGWSFGGYMSALAVMRYPSLFHAAFVGAPVCDWRDYDTNYVERVLGLPTDDDSPTDPYRRSSVLTYAKQLLRPLLLVHGSADDNVYFMHAIKMSAELFAHGRPHVFLPLGGTHMLADARVTLSMYARLALFMRQHIPTDSAKE